MDWSASCERLGAELYRAAGNVWARLQFEMEKSKEVGAGKWRLVGCGRKDNRVMC